MNIIREKDKTARRNIMMALLAELGYKSIKEFQKSCSLEADGLAGAKTYEALYFKLLKVEVVNFAGNFYQEAFQKKQIVWHHSAGWDNARGMYDWWINDKVYHVATAVGISDDGTVTRGYDEQFWAHHIGMSNLQNLQRNQESVAVEICNWGALTETAQGLKTWSGNVLPLDKAIELNYKGIKFFEKYTETEIKALKYWTLLNAMRFDIPLAYREFEMWHLNNKAVNGEAGIYTHNSFIEWKSDVSPQPKLIEMAKTLVDYAK
jgi:hypothetical protein